MPVLRGLITEDGCLAKVSIGWSHSRAMQLRLAHRHVPAPLEVTALLDTGAESTCLNTRLIDELDLPVGGIVIANAPAIQDVSFVYSHDASLTILHPAGQNLLVRNLPVLDLPLDLLGYQALIGRDILARCRFLFDGVNKSFALKY